MVQECHDGRLTGRMGREKINEETPFKRLFKNLLLIYQTIYETDKQVKEAKANLKKVVHECNAGMLGQHS